MLQEQRVVAAIAVAAGRTVATALVAGPIAAYKDQSMRKKMCIDCQSSRSEASEELSRGSGCGIVDTRETMKGAG